MGKEAIEVEAADPELGGRPYRKLPAEAVPAGLSREPAGEEPGAPHKQRGARPPVVAVEDRVVPEAAALLGAAPRLERAETPRAA